MLYTAVEEAPSDESVEPEVISRHFASFDEVFFTFCDRELKKINTFYSGEAISGIKRITVYLPAICRDVSPLCRKIGRSHSQICSFTK